MFKSTGVKRIRLYNSEMINYQTEKVRQLNLPILVLDLSIESRQKHSMTYIKMITNLKLISLISEEMTLITVNF